MTHPLARYAGLLTVLLLIFVLISFDWQSGGDSRETVVRFRLPVTGENRWPANLVYVMNLRDSGQMFRVPVEPDGVSVTLPKDGIYVM